MSKPINHMPIELKVNFDTTVSGDDQRLVQQAVSKALEQQGYNADIKVYDKTNSTGLHELNINIDWVDAQNYAQNQGAVYEFRSIVEQALSEFTSQNYIKMHPKGPDYSVVLSTDQHNIRLHPADAEVQDAILAAMPAASASIN